MTKKLEAIGPYTADHPGPFCTRDGRPVEIKIRDGRGKHPVWGYIGTSQHLGRRDKDGFYHDITRKTTSDFMNAREVPEPREFWVNEYEDGLGPCVHTERAVAVSSGAGRADYLQTIHLREVLDEPAPLHTNTKEAEKWQIKTL